MSQGKARQDLPSCTAKALCTPFPPANTDDHLTKTGRKKREKTLNMRRLRRERLQISEETLHWLEALRPRTRSECRDSARPCPHVSCKHHLYLDVSAETGSIKLNFPGQEVWELKETCVLDIAERGGITLEEVGALMNLTRERIRQVEHSAREKIATLLQEIREDLLSDHDTFT